MNKEELKKMLAETINQNGYELISLDEKKDKDGLILSIVVDRDSPIDLDAISAISEIISNRLDEIDPYESPYSLDVSSLGAEKPLKVNNLKPYINQYVHVHLINPIEGENIYEGDLIEENNENIVLQYKIKTRIKILNIVKNNIQKIRLAIKF